MSSKLEDLKCTVCKGPITEKEHKQTEKAMNKLDMDDFEAVIESMGLSNDGKWETAKICRRCFDYYN